MFLRLFFAAALLLIPYQAASQQTVCIDGKCYRVESRPLRPYAAPKLVPAPSIALEFVTQPGGSCPAAPAAESPAVVTTETTSVTTVTRMRPVATVARAPFGLLRRMHANRVAARQARQAARLGY